MQLVRAEKLTGVSCSGDSVEIIKTTVLKNTKKVNTERYAPGVFGFKPIKNLNQSPSPKA